LLLLIVIVVYFFVVHCYCCSLLLFYFIVVYFIVVHCYCCLFYGCSLLLFLFFCCLLLLLLSTYKCFYSASVIASACSASASVIACACSAPGCRRCSRPIVVVVAHHAIHPTFYNLRHIRAILLLAIGRKILLPEKVKVGFIFTIVPQSTGPESVNTGLWHSVFKHDLVTIA
jgi:hypothetical protein